MELKIDGINDHVEQVIKAHIAKALAGDGDVLASIIGKICNEKSSHKHIFPAVNFIEEQIRTIIEEMVHREVTEMLREREGEFKDRIRKCVREKHASLLRRVEQASFQVLDSQCDGSGEVRIRVQIDK